MGNKTKAALVTITAALVAIAVLAVTGSRGAGGPTINEVFLHCTPNPNQQVDPILHYSLGTSAHMHTPAGANAFSDSTTVSEMLSSSTSCVVSSDHSMFWSPTNMTSAGAPASVLSESYYLTNQPPFTLDAANPTPDGLRFIAGNSTCNNTTCDTNVEYQCAGSTATTHKIPTLCPAGKGYNETIYSINQCWDGGPGVAGSLGGGMGDATDPNVIGTNLVQGSNPSCPTTTTPSGTPWIVIPGIVWTIHIGQDGVGGYLSSDAAISSPCNGCSGHFDFVLGQNQAALSAIDSMCLNVTGLPSGVQQSCVEKPNGDGTDDLYALDSTGHYTVLVTN